MSDPKLSRCHTMIPKLTMSLTSDIIQITKVTTRQAETNINELSDEL